MSNDNWKLIDDDDNLQGRVADYYLEGPDDKPLPVDRVWGGISWPGGSPAYACLAVQPIHSGSGGPLRSNMRRGDEPEAVWPVYLVSEVEGRTVEEFVRRLLAAEQGWKVESWYREDDDTSKRFASKAYSLARAAEGRWHHSLSMVASPLAGQPGLAVDSLLSALEEQKIILGPQAPILANQVQVVPTLPRTELIRRLEDDLHAVRALTHVLGAFDRRALMMRPRRRGRRRNPALAY